MEFIKDHNKFAYNILSEVMIHCTNEGCKTILQVGNLKNHLKICEYRKIDCPYCDTKDILRFEKTLSFKFKRSFNLNYR